MLLLWLKALHVIAVIAWMAGILYVFRLFVYHVEETETVVMARLTEWERKLLNRITTPAMVATVVFGVSQIALMPGYYLRQPWLHGKLLLVGGLIATHVWALRIHKRLIHDPHAYKGKTLRLANELPTLLMMGIVILVILKPWAR